MLRSSFIFICFKCWFLHVCCFTRGRTKGKISLICIIAHDHVEWAKQLADWFRELEGMMLN